MRECVMASRAVFNSSIDIASVAIFQNATLPVSRVFRARGTLRYLFLPPLAHTIHLTTTTPGGSHFMLVLIIPPGAPLEPFREA
jgi:hypothetical protein